MAPRVPRHARNVQPVVGLPQGVPPRQHTHNAVSRVPVVMQTSINHIDHLIS